MMVLMSKVLISLAQNISKIVFPYFCSICECKSDQSMDLCSICTKLLPWIQDRCYRCGVRLEQIDEAVTCKQCQENPPKFDRLCALFDYVPPAINLVTGLKFGRRLAFGRVLGELFSDQILEEWYSPDTLPEAIIPVPLHPVRIRNRGYNQAMELLYPIKKRIGIPVYDDLCQRLRNTKPQSGLVAELRKQNLQNAFAINKRKIRKLKLQHIAIMDDVVTTGSTVSAISAILKDAGILQIDIWCICRG